MLDTAYHISSRIKQVVICEEVNGSLYVQEISIQMELQYDNFINSPCAAF